jgi:hypothetical protein
LVPVGINNFDLPIPLAKFTGGVVPFGDLLLPLANVKVPCPLNFPSLNPPTYLFPCVPKTPIPERLPAPSGRSGRWVEKPYGGYAVVPLPDEIQVQSKSNLKFLVITMS